MFTKSSILLAALALASEVASMSLSSTESIARDRHTRMNKRRGVALNGTNSTSGMPCKRGDAAGNAAAYNVKIVGATTNVTVVPNAYVQGNGRSGTRRPLQQSSNNREGLPSSASSSSSSWSAPSSSWSSATPSASIVAAQGSSGGMSVVTSWSGSDFEDWDFFNYEDPTHGNVDYVSQSDAQSANLIGLQDGNFKMSVDTGSLLGDGNRKSVRISSPTNWKKGQLVVAAIAHMPEGCGTWPAFWSIGAKRAWPAGGEIDILEGVNNVAGNTYSLHTTTGCSMSGQSSATSLALTQDCQYQPGCSYKDRVDNSFGPSFNSAGGGVYAAFFDDEGIKIWFWTANDVPSGLAAGSPDMSAFGTPKAVFGSSSCDMDTFFDDEQMLIINTTLMGDWAGATFWQNGCTGALADVLSNGSNFDNAYWLINSIKIYQ